MKPAVKKITYWAIGRRAAVNIFDRSLHNEGRAIAQICGVCRERRRSGGTAGMPVARLGAVSIKGCRGAGQRVLTPNKACEGVGVCTTQLA